MALELQVKIFHRLFSQITAAGIYIQIIVFIFLENLRTLTDVVNLSTAAANLSGNGSSD